MRNALIISTGVTVLLLFGYVSYRGYETWKQDHLLSMTRSFLNKSDERSALFCLRQILQINPHHLEAARIMADLTTAADSQSHDRRQTRVVESSPRSGTQTGGTPVLSQPATILAGTLILLPFGASMIRIVHRKGAA